ncbi:MAG: ABC transporter permease [Desulfuromonadaceae bacterium]
MNRSLRNIPAFWVSSFLLTLFVWHSVVVVFRVPEYLLPTPISVIRELFDSELYSFYLRQAYRTGSEAAAGFLLGNLLAILFGIIMYRFSRLQKLTMPTVAAFQAIPIVAVAPLLIVWFGSGILSKILMAAIISFFPTMAAILSSFSEVDHNAKHLFRLYRAGYMSTVRHLLIPAALPSLVTGFKISAGLATVGAIVAEMTGADAGIGYIILNAAYRMETVKLFVGIILAAILGLTGFVLPNIIRNLYPHAWASSRFGDES